MGRLQGVQLLGDWGMRNESDGMGCFRILAEGAQRLRHRVMGNTSGGMGREEIGCGLCTSMPQSMWVKGKQKIRYNEEIGLNEVEGGGGQYRLICSHGTFSV